MSKLVTTATLIRGKVYTLRHPDGTPQDPKDSIRFEYGKPQVLDDPKIAAYLEKLHDKISDGDGEEWEKPVFRISRNVPDPREASIEDELRPRRVSASRTVKVAGNGRPGKLRRPS
jgi:hypothetical protein